jgi:hypothetical protein
MPGLQAVTWQLEQWIAVVRAEQDRRQAGATVSRPIWKNLVFTGVGGAGKSRAARAVTRIYHDLGILTYAHLEEVAAATLVGSTAEETGTLLGQAVSWATGGVLMITGVHAWRELPDRGQQMLARLYRELTSARSQWGDKLAVILAGHKDPVGELLDASPPLAARFPVIIEFPGYTPSQLAAIFAALAGEAGFTLASGTADKAAATLALTDGGRSSGNARAAVQLLDQARDAQARRIAQIPGGPGRGALTMITADDIPGRLQFRDPDPDQQPGPYL